MKSDELRRLVERYHAGELTADERAELTAALEDPEVRRLFVQDLTLVAALRHTHRVEQARLQTSGDKTGTASRLAPSLSLRPVFFRRAGWLVAAALVLCLGGLVVWYAGHTGGLPTVSTTGIAKRPVPPETGSAVVADVSPQGECAGPGTLRVQDGGVIDLSVGAQGVLAEHQLTLRSGAVECRFPATAAATALRVPPPPEFTLKTDIGSVASREASYRLRLNPASADALAAPTMTVQVQSGDVEVNCGGLQTALAAGETGIFGDPDLPPTVPIELKGFVGMMTGFVIRVDADGFVFQIDRAFSQDQKYRLLDARIKGVKVKVTTDSLKAPVTLAPKNGVYVRVQERDGVFEATSVTRSKQTAPDNVDLDQF